MNWNNIKYFKKEEFRPPDYDEDFEMHETIISVLDKTRRMFGRPITVKRNGGFSVTGHTSNSYHYRGMAADVSLKGYDAFDAVLRIVYANTILGTLVSIGAYPHWFTQGIHIDVRSQEIGIPPLFWYRDLDKNYRYYRHVGEMLKDLAIEMKSYDKFIKK